MGIAELVAYIPDRHILASQRPHMKNRLQANPGDAKRNDRMGVIVDHRLNRPQAAFEQTVLGGAVGAVAVVFIFVDLGQV